MFFTLYKLNTVLLQHVLTRKIYFRLKLKKQKSYYWKYYWKSPKHHKWKQLILWNDIYQLNINDPYTQHLLIILENFPSHTYLGTWYAHISKSTKGKYLPLMDWQHHINCIISNTWSILKHNLCVYGSERPSVVNSAEKGVSFWAYLPHAQVPWGSMEGSEKNQPPA